jgi:hypothetical protein
VTVNEYLAGSLAGSLNMLKMHLNDMTDAELLMRPTPGANHANWQIGHLIVSEHSLLAKCGATMPELPAGFAERYSKENTKIDDASKFATKADLLAQFDRVRNASIAFVKSATDAQLSAPSPMPQWLPTVADVVGLGSMHIGMHAGQIQVLRRKLGKPVLF